MNLEAAREAAACSVLSEAAAEPFRRYLLRDPEVIPPGSTAPTWRWMSSGPSTPSIAYAGSLSDARKRLPLLLEAFSDLRRARPDAQPAIAQPAGAVARALTCPTESSWRRRTPRTSWRASWRAAHVSVLPAVEEAFGLVLAESLAAGTPVVAARSGAGPEIATDDVGCLFEPDDRESLVEALECGLGLAEAGAARGLPRARARVGLVGPRPALRGARARRGRGVMSSVRPTASRRARRAASAAWPRAARS